MTRQVPSQLKDEDDRMSTPDNRDPQAEQDHAEWLGWAEAQGYVLDTGDRPEHAIGDLRDTFHGGMQAERDLADARKPQAGTFSEAAVQVAREAIGTHMVLRESPEQIARAVLAAVAAAAPKTAPELAEQVWERRTQAAGTAPELAGPRSHRARGAVLMKPYECLDGEDNELMIKPGLPGCAEVSVKEPGGDHAVLEVAANDVPAAALALYEAADLPAPLILPRPGHDFDIEHAGSGDRGAYTSRLAAKVLIGWRGIEPQELDPDKALEFAAHIAMNALAVKESKLLAEIDRLAELIHAADFDLDYESRHALARSILLGGYSKRETQA